jgi:O-antigen/teichoic acid export membrane protein
MAAVQVPAMVCLALLAEPVVRVLLGPQWGEVPPLVRLMAMGMVWMFPAFLTYPMLVALGRIRETLVSSLISIPPSILLIAAAAPYGLTAVAAIDLAWREILRTVAPGAVATLGAAGGILAVMSLLGFRTALSFSEMLAAIFAAGLGWLAGLWLSGHPLIGELLGVWGRLRRWA